MPEKMSALEREHWNLAVANNNTFRRFILKYGDKTLRQISSPGPKAWSRDLFRGPEKDRYILDPKDHNLVAIDIGHFFAAAQAPLGLGNYLGALVELEQLRKGQGSAFQGEDFKSNALGTIFGRFYLNDPKEGKSLAEKLKNFLRDYENDSILFQPLEQPYGANFREQHTASNQEVDTQSKNEITAQLLRSASTGGVSRASEAEAKNPALEAGSRINNVSNALRSNINSGDEAGVMKSLSDLTSIYREQAKLADSKELRREQLYYASKYTVLASKVKSGEISLHEIEDRVDKLGLTDNTSSNQISSARLEQYTEIVNAYTDKNGRVDLVSLNRDMKDNNADQETINGVNSLVPPGIQLSTEQSRPKMQNTL